MGQLGAKLRRIGAAQGYTAGGLAHWCPACGEMHAFALDGKNASGAQWTWDGNVEHPTFTPSMHIKIGKYADQNWQEETAGESSVCHYILTAGVINYCGDCTHAMKGQSIRLPDLPAHLRDAALP
jgi:hypothetical protein